MIIPTFHGSLDRSIDRFHIATHFGCRDQALSAIGAKRFLDSATSGLPTLYKVMIQVQKSLLCSFEKDWGKFGPQGALLPIKGLLMKEEESPEVRLDISKRFTAHHKTIGEISCPAAAIVEAERILLAEANGKYVVLQYENSVEEKGSGYCVLDPSRITLVEVTYPGWSEVIEAFKAHKDYYQVKSEVETFQSALRARGV